MITYTIDQVETIRERRDAARAEVGRQKQQMRSILAQTESRADGKVLASEQREFERMQRELDRLEADETSFSERVEEMLTSLARQDAAAGAHRVAGSDAGASLLSVTEPETYQRGGQHSFLKDMIHARNGDLDAAQRLQRSQQELRALGNTGAVGGSGGEFAPPLWLVEDFVKLARPGRVFADRLTHDALPSGVSSVDIPKVSTGTVTAVQSTQNTALSSVDPTTTYLSSGITSIGGKNVVAQQLLDQSAIRFDKVILGDLAADYARALDVQTIMGTGTAGQLLGVYTYFTASGTANYTYTQATPSVTGAGGFYSALNHAISNIATSRYLPPTCIVMHPRRWSWIAAAMDPNGRPLVTPTGNSYNSIATAEQVAAQGIVGEIVGLPVYTDANIPTNLGGGTNQDPVFVMRAEDLYLWESDLRMESFNQPYADSAGVLFRALGYSAAIPSRYASAVSVINGTGLVTPAY